MLLKKAPRDPTLVSHLIKTKGKVEIYMNKVRKDRERLSQIYICRGGKCGAAGEKKEMKT